MTSHRRPSGLAPLLALLVLVPPTASQSSAPFLRLRPSAPSDRDLLGAHARFALEPEARARSRATGPDSLTLAVLRVVFPPDDDPETTGDGTFDLSDPGGGGLDRPPHDRAYFERQILALRNYWLAVSHGQLRLGYVLFPAGDATAFRLPSPMRYYNPDSTAAALDRRLAEFLRDAVTAADTLVDFPAFDAAVIFHAGVGQDLALDDATPSDLPSAFLSFRELKAALAPDDPGFQGIPVEGGAAFVRDGMWLPETEVQEGIEFSLLGVMASLFGSQLGLPSLFNTESGAPGIGRFGLMDQGGGNEAGKLPAAPCAWSRFFLGFSTPAVIRRGTGITLRAALTGGDINPTAEPDLVLLPIDSREYFLLENRQQELDGAPGFTLVDSLGTIVGVVAGEYDAGIPGSGLLVWHIDEGVIRAGLETNTVNADFNRRGVDLEEADGVQDIGIRPQGGFGLAADCYREGGATRFAPDTAPSSASNRGADTHIAVSGVSATAITMSFDVDVDLAQPGWPDSTLAATGLPGVSLAAGHVDPASGGSAVVLLAPDGTLVARRSDGADLFPPLALADPARGVPLVADLEVGLPGEEIAVATSGGVRVVDAAGSAATLSDWARFLAPAENGGPIAVPSPDGLALAVLAADGFLHVWRGSEDLPGFPLKPAAEPRSNLAFDGVALDFASGNEILRVIAGSSVDPEVIRLPLAVPGQLWIAAGTFPRPPAGLLPLAVVSRTAGEVSLLGADGTVRPGWPRPTGERHLGPPALADLDGDGHLDLLVPGEGRLWALTATGALLPGWPAALDSSAAGLALESGPVVSDLDGDGRLDAAIGSPRGGLFAFDAGGRRLAGWPLPAGDANLGSPVLADLDADGDLEIATAATDGWLHAYGLSGPVAPGPPTPRFQAWPGYGGPGQSFAHRLELAAGEPAPLLPEASITIYPNPTSREARIRYEVAGDTVVRVAIFDAAGRIVRELSTQHPFGGLNETVWDGRDRDGDPVPSGVYVCRIEARAGGRTVERLEPIAVTR